MEIIKNSPEYEILTPRKSLQAQLLNIERAGRTCYQSYRGAITKESAKKFITMIIKRGHESVIEHSTMTVRFSNVSRGFTHELVRHRLASYSQESTRYVDYAKDSREADLDKFQIKFIVPPHRDEKEAVKLEDGRNLSFSEMLQNVEMFYRGLRKSGWKPEDARQILPIGTKAEIVITANLREWRHIFYMRTSKYAHWEIREVMCRLLKDVQKDLSPVFDDFERKESDDSDIPCYTKKS